MWLMQNALANPDNAGAAATAYMNLMGIVALGQMWLIMARAAKEALDAGAGDDDFYRGQADHRALFRRAVAARRGELRRKLEAGAETMMAMPAEAF